MVADAELLGQLPAGGVEDRAGDAVRWQPMAPADLDPELAGDERVDLRGEIAQSISQGDCAGEQEPHEGDRGCVVVPRECREAGENPILLRPGCAAGPVPQVEKADDHGQVGLACTPPRPSRSCLAHQRGLGIVESEVVSHAHLALLQVSCCLCRTGVQGIVSLLACQISTDMFLLWTGTRSWKQPASPAG